MAVGRVVTMTAPLGGLSLFDSLLVAHLVGDWLLQSEHQALAKARSWGALLAHLAVYHVLVLGALLLYFPAPDLRIYVAVLLLAASHAWLDRGTHVVSLMRALRIIQRREPERWLHLATDQTLHILALALVAAWLSWGR